MDGLLADLFNTISHKLYNKEYKVLTAEEKREAKIIWVDVNEFKKRFGEVKEFFANLEPFSKTNDIVKLVVDFTKNNNDVFEEGFYICSHPASIDWRASEAGKIIWLKKHLNIQPNEMFFPKKKSIYAVGDNSTPNILIDDFPPYIQAWRDAGGISIEMRTDSVKDIYTYLTPKLEQAKIQLNEFINKHSIQAESFDSLVSKLLADLI